MKVKVWSRHGEEVLPFQKNKGDAGWDLYATEDIVLPPNSEWLVDTGLVFDFTEAEGPVHYLIYPRSSMGIKHGVTLKNSTGVIDKPYCGPNDTVKVPLVRNCYMKKFKEYDREEMEAYQYDFFSYLSQKDMYRVHFVGDKCYVFMKDEYVHVIRKGERFAQIVFYNHIEPEFEYMGEQREDGEDRGGLGSSGK